MTERWIYAVVALIALGACSGQNGSSNGALIEGGHLEQVPGAEAVIEFDTLWHQFGTIIEGEQVVCFFDYRNAGQARLVLNSVHGSCGCTSLDWEKAPLEPGEEASLQVMFDSKGRTGVQRKYVTVNSNASNATVELIIEATVIRQ